MTFPTFHPSEDFFPYTASFSRAQIDETGTGMTAPVVFASKVPCSGITPHDSDFDNFERQGTFIAQDTCFVNPGAVELKVGDILVVDQDTNSKEFRIERVDWWPRINPKYNQLRLEYSN